MRAVPVFLVFVMASAGCVASLDSSALTRAATDGPVVIPIDAFYDADGKPGYMPHEPERIPFHTLEELEARILGFEERRPDLVTVEVFGESLEGRPLYDIIVTNKAVPGPKPKPWFDAGHHANEMLGTELTLYTIDFLLDNYDTNATVRSWVDTLEIHNIPLVNPDGYVVQERGNALGVNLNRNYDIDWGNPGGASNLVMGTLAHETGRAMPSVAIVAENSGPHAFSEPETVAMRDRMAAVDADGGMAFYHSAHTPTNGMIASWAAFDHPFPMPQDKDDVLWTILDWVNANTEYKAGKAQWGDFSAGLPYAASGSSMDWAFLTHDVPAFTTEVEIWWTSVFSDDYAQRYYIEPYKGLRYWLDSALPITLLLLANAHELAEWRPATLAPPLPDGIPPERDGALAACERLPSDEHPQRGPDPFAVCDLMQPQH